VLTSATRTALLLLAFVASAATIAACGASAGGPADGADPDVGRGEELFAANCASCHGSVGQGADTGPPLVHEIYEPGHHSDEAFQLAAARGAPAHHWGFGDMPPIGGLDRGEVADIIDHVRQLQREAGIAR